MIQKKGTFIVVEGLDGSGKSTQAERIYNYLNEHHNKLIFGYAGVHLTKEPTSSLIGGLIQSQLAGDWASSPECLQLLFAADRAYHLEKEIIPLIEKGVVVISDRYFFSSFAYGGLGFKTMNWLFEINKNFLVPDMTFFIDVSPRECIERIKRERFEVTLFEKEKELTQVRENYKKLLRKFKNMHRINGEESADDVAQAIMNILNIKMGA